MSGPKVSSYELEQRRRRQMEEAARRERERREAEIRAQVERETRAAREKLEREKQQFDKTTDSIDKAIAEAQRRQREREKELQKQQNVKPVVEQQRIAPSKVLDFDSLMQERQDNTDPDPQAENTDSIVEELLGGPVELRSLLDDYIPRNASAETASDAGKDRAEPARDDEFESLLLQMEREYQELLQDRMFFRQKRDEILRFEEVCKRQREYHSHKILRDVYYGDFSRLRKEQQKWHKLYEKWREPFQVAYIEYRVACEMLGQKPRHCYLRVETAESDIAELNRETEQLRAEYLSRQESMEITRVLNEVMEKMGYQVLGTKDNINRKGDAVHNTVFSYGEGSGIHVVDTGSSITMEIVGLEDEQREVSAEEQQYLVEEQEHFCDSYAEIEQELAKRGVVLKKRVKMMPPSGEYATIMKMDGYTMTEESTGVKRLSSADKKAVRKQQKKKYMDGQ